MKTHLRNIFILLYIILSTSYMYSIELNFKTYSVEDGLLSNTIYTIIQDSKGFIWIGTEDGISRFNGYEFRNYQHKPRNTTSLINNHVYYILEDDESTIWIGTEEGVCTYNPQTNLFTPFQVKSTDQTAIGGRIQSMIFDEKGDLWFGVYQQGVFHYDRKRKKLQRYTFDKYLNCKCDPNFVTCVYKDKKNNIWASVNNTEHRIYKLDKKSDSFVAAYPMIDSKSLSMLSAYSMLEDTFGTMWFGTWSNGLCTIDKNTETVRSYLNTENKDKILHIHTITEYEPGKLLIGSNDGLTVFNVSPFLGNRFETHLKEPALSDRFVYPIYKDREGGLWIGTYYGGINYASPNRNYFTRYRHDRYQNSVSGNVMSTFCEDKKGNLWIGTDDGGLNYYNPKTDQFKVYKPEVNRNSISYHNIHGLCIDEDNLWIGTYMGGLNLMNTTTSTFKYYQYSLSDTMSLYSNSIYSVYKDSNSDVWVGTTSGINRYNPEGDNFYRMQATSIVNDILQIGNTVWFATIGDGLYAYDMQSRKWKNYKFDVADESSLISNDVICLCADDDKQLWIGTNSGICTFDKANATFRQVSVSTHSQSIRNIFHDNGTLWITTSKGLVFYDIKSRKSRLFSESDGLLSDEFTQKSGIKTTSGRIYVGTAKGFNAFYPKQIETNRYSPPIEITDFQLFNKSVDINDYLITKDNVRELRLPYNKNAFSFEYTGLSFFATEKNEYAFILDNFDKDWSYVGNQRKATYTNIPPGEYYFRVRASNNDGIWNDTGLCIKVVISPPIWSTYWAMFIYIVVAIAAVIYLSNYIRRKNEKKHCEQIEKVKHEKEKEAYDSKINFFTTIAHEIRTPVSLIIGPLEKILATFTNLPEPIVEDMNIINRNSQRLLFLTNQLLDFRKIEREAIQVAVSEINLDELMTNIYTRFRPFIENRNITFTYNCDNKDFTASVDAENLTKVISNLLNNASKYTKDMIELTLTTRSSDSCITIAIKDNGIGISPEEQEKIYTPFYQIPDGRKPGTGLGLYLVKSIMAALGGTIELDSKKDEGSTFSLHVPIDKKKQGKEALAATSQIKIDNIAPDNSNCKESINEECIHSQTLLIVEDNQDLRNFIISCLSDKYQTLTASDGNEAIAMLEKNSIDIIISDIMMPNMDGIEFCNVVKNNFLWSHIPIILLTAKTNQSVKLEALEVGADAYIEKPFSIIHIQAQIKNLLESRRILLNKFAETPFASLKSIAGNKTDEEFLNRVNDIIERNISNIDFSVEKLAEELCISSSGLFAKLKELSGMTPNKLLLLIRLKKAAELLSENKYRVNEVCYMVGFNNPSYFAKCFQKQFNLLPKDMLGYINKQNSYFYPAK